MFCLVHVSICLEIPQNQIVLDLLNSNEDTFPLQNSAVHGTPVLFSILLYALLRIFSAVTCGMPFLVTSDFVELLSGAKNR